MKYDNGADDFLNLYRIPEDRLLIFRVQEGWEPLCKVRRAPAYRYHTPSLTLAALLLPIRVPRATTDHIEALALTCITHSSSKFPSPRSPSLA